MRTFSGVMPALVTPFTPDDKPDLHVLRALVEYHLSKGVNGFYLCGSTGEGLALTVAERQAITGTVLEQVAGRVPVLVHVGALALHDAITLAIHAREQGAAAISSILPANYTTLDSLRAYFERLAEAVPDLPLLPYLIHPQIAPLQLMEALLPIPGIGGTKYTGPDMYEMGQIIQMGQGRPWTVFSGMDEQCVYAAMMGANGCIGSTINLMPGAYLRLKALVAGGRLAEAHDLQLRINRVTTVLIRYGVLAALKYALGLLGFDCGQPRLPSSSLPAAQQPALRAALEQQDFMALVHLTAPEPTTGTPA
ncbi:MAG: dihydrodipicolinate synthase family protein [Anaerolineae bacterium]|nr:dihydrodipicolinate synthase family protein [Anaerolineae bacterium]